MFVNVYPVWRLYWISQCETTDSGWQLFLLSVSNLLKTSAVSLISEQEIKLKQEKNLDVEWDTHVDVVHVYVCKEADSQCWAAGDRLRLWLLAHSQASSVAFQMTEHIELCRARQWSSIISLIGCSVKTRRETERKSGKRPFLSH